MFWKTKSKIDIDIDSYLSELSYQQLEYLHRKIANEKNNRNMIG